jgi:hydrogenase maturation protein HypF
MAEHACFDEPALVFAWDGVGLGEDGTLWGGEAFVGVPGQWRRVASLRPFRLPGGDAAGRSPWRSAAALCWEIGRECPVPVPDPIVHGAWQRGLNAPQSSAAGRVFDTASALVLGVRETSFEGQGPMWLEAVAARTAQGPELVLATDEAGIVRIDWAPLVDYLLASPPQRDVATRAGAVHASFSQVILQLARRQRAEAGVHTVGLTGGVFQNRLLTELAEHALKTDGFSVLLPVQVPCNDGGLSYGQVAEFAARNE